MLGGSHRTLQTLSSSHLCVQTGTFIPAKPNNPRVESLVPHNQLTGVLRASEFTCTGFAFILSFLFTSFSETRFVCIALAVLDLDCRPGLEIYLSSAPHQVKSLIFWGIVFIYFT